ncbi:HlyD family efflux transporter periplasmic adaptor subunit [Paenibacillus sp. GbtcB18]|uniref:HlyD family efflux transporter periplasmic adaptor subunit n=1 Tax=Paenibacillus sp. GbtcB18 TaxID=2824763 RepID=UPI001C3026B8|nr:HlyD family efflux transporter periplasmic adaptor subunit [Paenibacillus sp. GbtcB18]
MKWSGKVIGMSLAGVLLVGGGGYFAFGAVKKPMAGAAAQEVVVAVKKGDIRSTVSGTAQFEPKEKQTIVSPADATIKAMHLTRNMPVKAGDVLVELSSPTLENNLQKALMTQADIEKQIAELRRQQANMGTSAPIGGQLVLAPNIEVGSNVNKNTKIATVNDTTNLLATVLFPYEEALQLRSGEEIDLAVDGFSITKTGKVDAVNKTAKSDGKGGKALEVQIRIQNDGTLDAGLKVKASARIGNVSVDAVAESSLDYAKSAPVVAGVQGTISSLPNKSGTVVKAGASVAVLENDTIQSDISDKEAALEQQKLAVQEARDKVADLVVKAPFDGVFSTDFVNTKENILASLTPGAKVKNAFEFGAVANMELMQLPIQVDELDLNAIKTGMKAEVSVDSLQGKKFEGEVTQISSMGTTTNGVTFYDVILAVKNTNELKYGMTATANILIENKTGVLYVSPEALQSRQGKRYVTLKKADGTLEAQHEVKIGIRSTTQVEITEGLKEGDKVVVPQKTQQTKMTQQEIDRLRQQYQGGQGGQGSGGFQGGGGFPGGGQGGQGGQGGGGQRGNQTR